MSTKAPTATDQTATTPRERAPKPVAAGTRIGHVHLKTGDIERVYNFYVGILGFDVIFRMPEALFLSAGGYHHHREPRSVTPYVAWRKPAGPLTASTITARTRRCTCATPTATVWSWPGTGRRANGRGTKMAT